MTRTPWLLIVLAAGVTVAAAAPDATAPPPKKKPATEAATAPKAPAPAKPASEPAKPGTAPAKAASAPSKPASQAAKPAVKDAASPPKDAATKPAAPKNAEPKEEDSKDAEPLDTSSALKETGAGSKEKGDPNLGMSILGNQEAPKALVIVPWKSSDIGQATGLQMLLDDSRQPVDKDVFLRVLNYYDLRTSTTPTTTRQNGAKGGKS